ncbi:sulfite exporter TauE/SafE family protein [Faecousia sp. CLA-AA-H192]|uniref:Probable membrane transporter protein n=1 Tax=Faecousia intestinalis TaxID=3133167 RepID=A0ABV1G5W2_9FIRM
MSAWWAAALAGAVCGLLSGLGIGGGTLLMVWMTGVAALPQQTAQGINLLYFLPSAVCALIFHIRNKLIRWDIVLPAALGGCVTAAIAAWIATGLDVSLLRRLFGGFLLLTGLRELFFRQQRDKNAR